MNFRDRLIQVLRAVALLLVTLAAVEHLTYMRVAVVQRHKLEQKRNRTALKQVEARCNASLKAYKQLEKKVDNVHDWRVRLTLEARQRGWRMSGLRYGPERPADDDS